MPKRLFVVRPTLDTGGADRVTLTLLENLDRSLFAPTLVLIRPQGELFADIPDDVDVISLDSGGIFSAIPPLRRLINEGRPDIVLSTSSGTNITAALATPKPGPRLVLSERNGLVRGQHLHKTLGLLIAKRICYRRADCITTVSRGVANDLKSRLRLKSEILQVVYNPIVTPNLQTLASDPVSEPWFDSNKPVLLAAGRLTRAKGFDLLLAAFAGLLEEHDCRLIILGEGPLRSTLEQQARELRIDHLVKLPGFVSNPYAYMSRSTAFVLSSRFEGLPGVLIQAMACGTAVIATRCPFGPEEIVSDGRDGLLVQAGDATSLEEALKSLLKDDRRREEMAQEARVSAQRFQLEKIMPNYQRALDPDTR